MMKNKNLRRILYLCAVLVLLIMGIFVWLKTMRGESEKQTFVVNGLQEATFEYGMKVKHPKQFTVRFEGKLDCDALLIIKDDEEGNSIRFRRSFPVKAGELKDRELKGSWGNSNMVIEFKAKECVVNNVKIIVEVEG